MLLNHIGRANARAHGLSIQGEAVLDGEHSLLLIVEAETEQGLREFMAPFADAGTVEIKGATTCAGVLAVGGCGAPAPVTDYGVPAVDPADACQAAVEAGLVVHRANPLNCETSIPALIGGVVPNTRFYVRNHFQIPALDVASWRLSVGGAVERPLDFSLRDLQNMRSEADVVTLECAGNGRSMLDPAVDGEPWGLGAASTAEWTGVPLTEVLDRAGIRADALEVVFRGADRGRVDERDQPIHFERSLSVADARAAGALLAYAMNGDPLPLEHGYPLRLVVPGWYAVTSVKWLTEIEAVTEPFDGYYQYDRYQYEWERDGDVVREPVTLQRVRALITEPSDGGRVDAGELTIRGVAWSGAAAIARVEVRVGEGPWRDAHLVGARDRSSWQWWELIAPVDDVGATTVRARATDLAGRVQPDIPEWNRRGYGSNAVHAVGIDVVEGER
jgi:DMSO/TMAO reductase YedYZ molybdopterin-dependent catalytic subunit